ncbi:hypothetical protein ABPG77_001837 [Micractinium sp. CCAP 211/92]
MPAYSPPLRHAMWLLATCRRLHPACDSNTACILASVYVDKRSCSRRTAFCPPLLPSRAAAAMAEVHQQISVPLGPAVQQQSAEEERRQRLKAAGEAYFAKVLNQSKGKDLLAAAKTAGTRGGSALGGGGSVAPGSVASGATPQRLPLTTFDEDFLQAGAVIEGARTYVLGTIFVAAQAMQLVFLKSSLDALAAPALLLCLHFLPTAGALRLLGAQGALELRPLSLRTLQGGAARALLGGLQALTLFWAVLHCSVFVVLCWTVALPHVLRAAVDLAANKGLPPGPRLVGLGIGGGCTAATLLVLFPGLRGLLALLCWAAVEAAGAAWAQLRQRPELLPAGAPLTAPVQQLLDAEAALDSATLAYVEHLLPPLPVLLLGLVLREGSELVDHELSVPAVTMVLLSILAMVVSACSDQLISGGLTRQARAALAAAGPLGTTVTEAAVHGLGSPIAFAAAIAASLAGVLLRVTAVGSS